MPIQIDLSKGYVPVLVAIAAFISIATGAYTVGGIMTEMARDKSEFRSTLTRVETELTEIRKALAGRRDDASWCREAEAINKGWKCPGASK